MPWGHQASPLHNGKPGIPRLHTSQQSVTKTNLSHILFHNFPLSCSLRIHTKAAREKKIDCQRQSALHAVGG